MKAVSIYTSGNQFDINFRREKGKGHFYTRPLAQSYRISRMLNRLYLSHKYDFRPFLGGEFGIVVSRRTE